MAIKIENILDNRQICIMFHKFNNNNNLNLKNYEFVVILVKQKNFNFVIR